MPTFPFFKITKALLLVAAVSPFPMDNNLSVVTQAVLSPPPLVLKDPKENYAYESVRIFLPIAKDSVPNA